MNAQSAAVGDTTPKQPALAPTTSTSDRLEHSKWILEKVLHWIAAAEVKAGTVSAVDTALLGVLIAVYSENGWGAQREVQQLGFAATAICLLASMACVAACILPRTKGPQNSLMFFGCIGGQGHADYDVQLRAATDEQLLTDCITQIHRNSQIACQKFQWAKAATIWALVGSIMWVLAAAAAFKG